MDRWIPSILLLFWLQLAACAQSVDVLLVTAHRAFAQKEYRQAQANAEAVLRLEPDNKKARALLKLIVAQVGEGGSGSRSTHGYLVPEVRYNMPLGEVLDDLVRKAEQLSGGAAHLNLVRAFPDEWARQKIVSLEMRGVPLRVVLQNVADIAGLRIREDRGALVLQPKMPAAAVSPRSPVPPPGGPVPGNPAPSAAPKLPETPSDPNALPLPAFLTNGLVAVERVQLSEAQLANPAPAGAAELLDATPGAPLAYLRRGYVAQFVRFQSHGGLTTLLPEPVGGQTLGYALAASFMRFGELNVPQQGKVHFAGLRAFPRPFVPKTMRPYVLTPESELLDPLDRQEAILSNGGGAMREAWAFQPAPAEAPHFGLVKTQAGYFVGYLREKNAGPPRFTWMQLERQNDWRFRLRELRSVEIQKGARLFEMADLREAKRPMRLIDTAREVQLTPRLYEVLLRSGIAGICAVADAPLDDGVETIPIAPPGPGGRNQRTEVQKESRLQSILARYLQWGNASTQLTIEFVQEERPIYRTANGAIEKGPWTTAHLEKVISLDNDADGGLRLTDRKFIYDLQHVPGGAIKLTVYTVEESPDFTKAP